MRTYWTSLQEFCVIVIVSTYVPFASAYTKSYIMAEYCGDLIDFENKEISTVHVRLTDESVYKPHMSCTFAVRAPPGQRLLMATEWVDIDVGRFRSCSDYLSVWNGDFANRTDIVEGLKDRVCGNEAPPPVTSEDRALILHFDSNTYEDGKGFSLIFTAFHEGTCRREEFSCDNGRCIDNRLKCDEYDNCGDGSDDCFLTVGDVVIAVIVTTVVFFLIVGAAVLYCHRDKLKVRKKCPIIGADPDGVYQPTTEPVKAATESEQATTAV